MRTITLTDKQFDTLFEYLDGKVESIVNTSVDYQDSELLEDFEDLFEVHDILEDIKVQYERVSITISISLIICFSLVVVMCLVMANKSPLRRK